MKHGGSGQRGFPGVYKLGPKRTCGLRIETLLINSLLQSQAGQGPSGPNSWMVLPASSQTENTLAHLVWGKKLEGKASGLYAPRRLK